MLKSKGLKHACGLGITFSTTRNSIATKRSSQAGLVKDKTPQNRDKPLWLRSPGPAHPSLTRPSYSNRRNTPLNPSYIDNLQNDE